MRKSIIRTVDLSTVHAHKLTVVDGQPTICDLKPFTVFGKVTEKQALKQIQLEFGKGNYTISEIKTERACFEISVKDFMEHAKRID